MTDDAPEIVPLHFTQSIVHSVETWPERTSFARDWLASAYVYRATFSGDVTAPVAGDEVSFTIFNGHSVYRLTGEKDPGGAFVADLVDGKRTSRKV